MAQENHNLGAQLTNIRQFTGQPEDDVELFIAHVDRVRVAFGWTPANTAQLVANKLVDKAGKWLQVADTMGTDLTTWDNLKKQLTARFKRETSDVTAALMVSELQQGTGESVADFFDRCVLAMSKKNHRITDELKGNEDFKKVRDSELFVYFGGGLRKAIRNATICSSSPPADIEALLKAARNVEMQSEAREKLFELEEGKEGGQSKEGEEGLDEIAEQIEALQERFRRMGNGSRGRGRNDRNPQNQGNTKVCWGCGRKGHFRRECYALRSGRTGPGNRYPRGERRGVRDKVETDDREWSLGEVSGNE